MYEEISFILSVPTSTLLILFASMNANYKAIMPAIDAMPEYKIIFITSL
jgi:hypothetical protein